MPPLPPSLQAAYESASQSLIAYDNAVRSKCNDGHVSAQRGFAHMALGGLRAAIEMYLEDHGLAVTPPFEVAAESEPEIESALSFTDQMARAWEPSK